MTDDRPKGCVRFLFGCSPALTLSLLAILGALVFGVPLVRTIVARLNPPEPRTWPLPLRGEEPSWLMLDRWRFSRDVDGDGTVDCFVSAGSGTGFHVADGYEPSQCALTTLAWLGRLAGTRPLEGELRDALNETEAFKRDRGWQAVSVTDVDGDGRPDCVLHRPGGVIARRSGATCPGDGISIPADLETHERSGELADLFRLEQRVRAALAVAPERP